MEAFHVCSINDGPTSVYTPLTPVPEDGTIQSTNEIQKRLIAFYYLNGFVRNARPIRANFFCKHGTCTYRHKKTANAMVRRKTDAPSGDGFGDRPVPCRAN